MPYDTTPVTTVSAPLQTAGLPFALRPLTTGEVLDRSLSLYRGNFWFCIGLTLFAALVAQVSGLVRVMYVHVRHLPPTIGATTSVFLLISTVVGTVLAYGAHGFVGAGLHWGTASVYLGRPISIGAAVRVARLHWLRYALLALVQVLTAGWLTLLLYALLFAAILASRGSSSPTTTALLVGVLALLAFASAPYSVYRYLQVSLAMPASVLESLGIRDALRRSKALLPDRKGRIFVLFLLLGALYLVIRSASGVLSLLAVRGAIGLIVAQLATLLTTFVATMLLQPFYTVALCLFYYDERVRREGFDIEFLLSSTASSPSTADAGAR